MYISATNSTYNYILLYLSPYLLQFSVDYVYDFYCTHPLPPPAPQGLQPFNLNTSVCDWHFSEFSSCMNFALYCCCVELMALPLPGKDVARQLIQAIYAKYVLYSPCSKTYDLMMMSYY